jgi:hypothetical protein
MQEAHPQSTSFIEVYNKKIYQDDESYRSESESDGNDDEDGGNDFDSNSFDDSTNLDSHGESRSSNIDEKKQIENLARGETNGLRVWRLIVLLFIFTTCAILTTATFIFLRNQEENDSQKSVSSSLS